MKRKNTTSKKQTTAQKINDTESQLIELMRVDLNEGLNMVYREYHSHLLSVASNTLVGTRLAHLAEDALQDGFISAWLDLEEHPAKLHAPDFHLRAWLATIVHNKALAILEAGMARLELNSGLLGAEVKTEEGGYLGEDPTLHIERVQERWEAKRKVRKILPTLSPTHRTAIETKYLHNLREDGKEKTDKQVAEELNLPLPTVKSQLRRAKKNLREQVQKLTEESIWRLDSNSGTKKTS